MSSSPTFTPQPPSADHGTTPRRPGNNNNNNSSVSMSPSEINNSSINNNYNNNSYFQFGGQSRREMESQQIRNSANAHLNRDVVKFDIETQRRLALEKLASLEETDRLSPRKEGSTNNNSNNDEWISPSRSMMSAAAAAPSPAASFITTNKNDEKRASQIIGDNNNNNTDDNVLSDEDLAALEERVSSLESAKRDRQGKKIQANSKNEASSSSTVSGSIYAKVSREEEEQQLKSAGKKKVVIDAEEAALLQRLRDQRHRISSRADLIQRSYNSGVPLSRWASKKPKTGKDNNVDSDEDNFATNAVKQMERSTRPNTAPKDSATTNMEKNHSSLFEPAIPRHEDVNELMDRFRTTSIRSTEVAALVSEICLPGAVDLVLPDPHRFIASRIGDLLSSLFILKRDVFSATARPDFVGVMGGAPLFRMVPKFNVGAVSQPHSSGIRTILNEVAVEWQGKCVWVNLRDDPHIFLNQRSYSLRRQENPAEPVVTTGILAHRIEAMEEKLRREVVAESSRRGGNVIVHRESSSGVVDSQWEAIDEDTAFTTEALFKQPQVRSHANYIRLPFSARDISLARIDDIYKICSDFRDDPLIFNCQTGRGRSTFATVLACTIRFYQHQAKGLDTKQSVLDTIGKYNARSLSLLLAMVQVIPQGHTHERRVCLLCQVVGASSNFLDRMLMSFKSDRSSGTGRSLLNRYVHLVAFSRYCEEMLVLKEPQMPFSAWVASNEVSSVLRQTTAFAAEANQDSTESEATEQAAKMLAALDWRLHNEALTVANALVPEREHVTESITAIPGCYALRHPDENIPVVSCGHTVESGFRLLLEKFIKNYPWIGALYVVDVRSEPTIYIEGRPYTLADARSLAEHAPKSSITLSVQKLEDLETKLVFDVKKERDNQNAIYSHTADAAGNTTEDVIPAEESQRLQTPREFFESCNQYSTSLRYVRVPTAHQDAMDVRTCGDLVKQFYKCGDRSGVIIMDSEGTLRATLAINAAMVIRASMYRPLAEIGTDNDLRLALKAANPNSEQNDKPTSSTMSAALALFKPSLLSSRLFCAEQFGDRPAAVEPNQTSIELLVASQLAQMLAAGAMLRFTECVVSLCGRGNCWNALDAISDAKETWQRAAGVERDHWLKRTFAYVDLYLGVLLMAIFVDRVQRNEVDTDYENWLELNSEIHVAIDKAHENPKHGLKFILPQNLYLETQTGSVSRRKGNVLTANFGLKADHFPGAIRKNMVPYLPGVPNFRKVVGVNVYGVAIPTVRGVFNLMRLLGSAPGPIEPGEPGEKLDPLLGAWHPRYALFHPTNDALTSLELMPRPKRGKTVWFNLREEPLLYIADRPFVFRDLATPYVNVEFTGITTEKIESIEEILRDDVLAESKAHKGQFLIHDEIQPGVMGGLWEPAKPEQILTVRRLYENAEKAGCRIDFNRLPVTDEQTPEIEDFDSMTRVLLPEILNAATIEGESVSFVFNCQMGRGRTTTGMVTCCMLIGLCRGNYYSWLADTFPDSVLYPPGASEFANGNYRMINALSRALLDYRDAKHRVDLVLEACNKLQNLRVAIELFKNQLESPDTTEEGRMRAFHHGTHYLLRYFYLIVFNSYLHEEYDHQKKALKSTFRAWLDAHHEIVKIHERPDLK